MKANKQHSALEVIKKEQLKHGKFVLKESERRELSFLSFASSQRPDEC